MLVMFYTAIVNSFPLKYNKNVEEYKTIVNKLRRIILNLDMKME